MNGWGGAGARRGGLREKSREEVLPTTNSKVLGGPGWGRRDRGSGDVAEGEWTRREPKLWTDGFGREGPILVGRTDGLKLYQGHLNLKGLLHPCLKPRPHHRLLRAALHYGGEVHRSVKSLSTRHGYLRQGMVCHRR